MTRPSIHGILKELRRRKVFRTAGMYIVGAWVLLQVCELVFAVLQLPASAMQLVLVATIVGFPIALIIGWRYDITPDGIRRTPPAVASDHPVDLTLHRVDHLLLVGLALILALIVFQVPLPSEIWKASQLPDEASIAVMPFTFCENDEDEEVLAAGLSSAVRDGLAGRRRFKVSARTSSVLYAGFALAPQEIAKPLDVNYVLTGNLCRIGDTLVIESEVTDSEGFIVWSATFEQDTASTALISETLAVMVENGVASTLGDKLPNESELLINPRAYEHFLRGREFWRGGNKEKARENFESALELQPDYAKSRAYLAYVDASGHGFISREQGIGIEKSLPGLQEAHRLALQQLERSPRSWEAHAIAGDIMNNIAGAHVELAWRQARDAGEELTEHRMADADEEFAQAERHLRAAIQLNPTDGPYVALAELVMRRGRQDEGLEIWEQARVRDPFNKYVAGMIAHQWAVLGRYRQAMDMLETFDELPRFQKYTREKQLEIMGRWGYWDEKAELLIDMLLNEPEVFEEHPIFVFHAWWFTAILADLGMYEEADAWFSRLNVYVDLISWPPAQWMHDWYLSSTDRDEEIHERVRAEVAGKSDEDILAGNDGVVAAIAWKLAEIGETDRAIRLMEAVRHAPPLYMEEDGWGVILLARLYQHVGRDDDALPLLEEALEINKAKYAAGDRHPDTMSDLADIYARLDRSDEAYEMLHKALDYNFHWRGSFPGPDWLNLPEHVTRLAEDPRFIALEERNAMTREQMVSRIRSMLAQYDPDTLLAPALQLAEKWSES